MAPVEVPVKEPDKLDLPDFKSWPVTDKDEDDKIDYCHLSRYGFDTLCGSLSMRFVGVDSAGAQNKTCQWCGFPRCPKCKDIWFSLRDPHL